MASERAEIRDLDSKRQEVAVRGKAEGSGDGGQADVLARSSEELNATTVGRIAENEARRCVQVLEQAVRQAGRARQLRAMAQFAGNEDTDRALESALRRLATAASD